LAKRSIPIILLLIVLVYSLSRVFSGAWILPQSFSVGALTIHYYGIFMASAVAAGYLLAIKRAKNFGIQADQADVIIFWLVIGGFVGARLYHVLSSIEYYSHHAIDIFKVWNGGLSIYGAVLSGLVCVLLFAKSYKLKALYLLDWLTPSLVLGQIIGRFGNFFNYELYGYPTHLPWKMFVPVQFRGIAYQNNAFFHPLFLYEAIGNAIILFILLKVLKKPLPGALFLWYVLLYNVLRFFLEFLRIQSTIAFGLRINAYVSLVLAIAAVALLWRRSTYAKIS